jgi:hypothetical protein
MQMIKESEEASLCHQHGSEYSPVSGSCEHGNEPSVTMVILYKLGNYQLLKKHPAR